jgi:predicted transposase YbfD/YdcC
LNAYLNFPQVGQVFAIERVVTHLKKNETTTELVYGITSLTVAAASPKQVLQYNRGHWSIENKVHYVRDVTYDEDRSQVRTRNGPQAMACLRNFAISVLRLLEVKNIASALRDFAAKPAQPLKTLGF